MLLQGASVVFFALELPCWCHCRVQLHIAASRRLCWSGVCGAELSRRCCSMVGVTAGRGCYHERCCCGTWVLFPLTRSLRAACGSVARRGLMENTIAQCQNGRPFGCCPKTVAIWVYAGIFFCRAGGHIVVVAVCFPYIQTQRGYHSSKYVSCVVHARVKIQDYP